MQEELLENRVRLMQSAKSVGKFINLSSVIAPSVVIGRDGELVTTWKIQGMAFETSEDITLDGAINSLNILYRSLASNKTALAVQIHRLRRPMTDELSACEEAGFAHNLSKAYNKKISALKSGDTNATSDIYILFQFILKAKQMSYETMEGMFTGSTWDKIIESDQYLKMNTENSVIK